MFVFSRPVLLTRVTCGGASKQQAVSNRSLSMHAAGTSMYLHTNCLFSRIDFPMFSVVRCFSCFCWSCYTYCMAASTETTVMSVELRHGFLLRNLLQCSISVWWPIIIAEVWCKVQRTWFIFLELSGSADTCGWNTYCWWDITNHLECLRWCF